MDMMQNLHFIGTLVHGIPFFDDSQPWLMYSLQGRATMEALPFSKETELPEIVKF